MLFLKEEKVFSLAKTAAAVPWGSFSEIFSEFYCYLLITGLFREGESNEGVHWQIPAISDKSFSIPSGSYRSGLARIIAKGLKDRYNALITHQDISTKERELLQSLDYIFTNDVRQYVRLSGRDLYSVALTRDFSVEMRTVAAYVAVTFGQMDYPQTGELPSLYLSIFGNIHLSKNRLVTLKEPVLKYGSTFQAAGQVTALWAMLSAQVDSFIVQDETCETNSGDVLGDVLSKLGFLTEYSNLEKAIPVPSFASSLYAARLMGVDGYNPISLSVSFYKNFLYGTTNTLNVSRKVMLDVILDLMMKRMGETHLGHLFSSNSFYRKLSDTNVISGKNTKRPVILQFALEALDANAKQEDEGEVAGFDPTAETQEETSGYDPTASAEDSDDTSDTTDVAETSGFDPTASADTEDSETSSDEEASDSQSGESGFDPSAPPTMGNSTASVTDKNTIDLLSFDKSGEGVNEALYRDAVVALNDRLRSDDTLPVEGDVKDALDHWVNGYLFRTSITATQDQIAHLKLQSHLKNVLTKG